MTLENYKYNLKSLKKCDQYWDEMNPTTGGRLCSKCEKKIIDFSGMTFSDIAVFMSERNEPVCGFYLPQQLAEIKTSNFKLPIAIGLSTLISTTTIAEDAIPGRETIETPAINKPSANSTLKNETIESKLKLDTFYISGTVVYFDTATNSNRPVEFASVIVKGKNYGVTTDKLGNFSLRYQTVDTGTISIRISSVGFMTHEITDIDLKSKIELGTIKMQMWKSEITEFYVTYKKRSRLSKFWRKITKPFRR